MKDVTCTRSTVFNMYYSGARGTVEYSFRISLSKDDLGRLRVFPRRAGCPLARDRPMTSKGGETFAIARYCVENIKNRTLRLAVRSLRYLALVQTCRVQWSCPGRVVSASGLTPTCDRSPAAHSQMEQIVPALAAATAVPICALFLTMPWQEGRARAGQGRNMQQLTTLRAH